MGRDCDRRATLDESPATAGNTRAPAIAVLALCGQPHRVSEVSSSAHETDGREIPLLWSLLPVAALTILLYYFLQFVPKHLRSDLVFDGQLPLVLGAIVAGLVARKFGWRWESLAAGIANGIQTALPAILILMVIGMVIGAWIAAGVVPALITWGLDLLSPAYFLPASCAVCSIVSLIVGSSWSTAGTVGIALIGVGQTLGIPPGLTAGAVISGAYFGDKLSPMSETTNLAPAMAGTDLVTHIRHMLYTTVPSWTIAMILYTVIGLSYGAETSPDDIAAIQATIAQAYHPSILHALPPLLVLFLVLRQLPAIPSLLLGIATTLVLGAFTGVSPLDILTSAMSGYTSHTGLPALDKLLSRGGMASMMPTVSLIFCAMAFGGILERTGMLRKMAGFVLQLARNSGSLIATTILTSIAINILAADQYISIVVPGRMYAGAYAERHMHPKNLSRALEDGGTITSALVPWNSCGAYMAATLGVATVSYLPYAFFNLINPVLAITFALLGIGIAKTSSADPQTAATLENDPC